MENEKTTICGADCSQCFLQKKCPGCAATQGCPHGKPCFVARYIRLGGMDAYRAFQNTLLGEINALAVPGMAEVRALTPMLGQCINLEYPLPGGQQVKFLDDNTIYFAAQTACTFAADAGRCFGVVAAPQFLLVSEYAPGGRDPELVLYRRR